ncbi:putative Ig domain-containing protein [Patescibacteria group bacterium]|nr:putative Ig domain-containing protein [Patescibacteria group bacterium]
MTLTSLTRKLTSLTTFGVVLGSFGLFVSSVQAAPQLTPSTLPDGYVGAYYDQRVNLDAPGTFSWSISAGSLPPGVLQGSATESADIRLRGRLSTAGTYTFTIRAATLPPAAAAAYTRSYTVVIRPMEIEQSATLPTARVGTGYSMPLSVAGGIAPYEWTVLSGGLPTGISLNATTGALTGGPTVSGSYTFTINAKDANGLNANKPFSLLVEAVPTAPLEILNGETLTNGRVNNAYNVDLYATGGTTPYRWNLSLGSNLPPGLTLTTSNNLGQLRGTPTAAGTYNFSVKLLDVNDNSITKTFSLTVNTPIVSPPIITPVPTINPLAITTTVGANGTVGMDYYTSLTATGGTAPYRWNFASGTLPPGVTLSNNGTLSGRPTAAGSYTAYLEVFDATNAYVGQNFTFTIASAPSTPSTPTPTTPELTNRLNNLSRIGVSVHALVKLPDDGNRFTQVDSAVYYVGGDGRRHAFPNDRVFSTWYSDFNGVRVVSQSDLASIPLGANVTYKPGVKLVKFATDPKVYAVSSNRVLRWVKTEAAAQALYGSTWNRQVDDVFDTFYGDYSFGSNIETVSDYNRTSIQASARYVSDSLPL